MKIKNIKINNFGNLWKREIDFENGINLVYGKNETGKSTLLNFLRTTFYGISKNKNGREMSDYGKYFPWIGEEFSGKIRYELDNEKIFEVYRDFKKKNPIIFDEKLEDISSNFKIDKKDGNQFFYEQTGIDENTYLSTIMSPQQELVLNNQYQNFLIQKLANLAGTGEDKVSYQKAIERLNKRLVEEVGTSRTQDRPINIVENAIARVKEDLKTKKDLTDTKQKLEEEKIIYEAKLKNEEEQNNTLCKLNMLTNKYEVEMEKNELKIKMKDEQEKNVKSKIQERDFLLKKNSNNEQTKRQTTKTEHDKKSMKKTKQNYLFFIVTFVALIILNLFNFNLIKNKIINYLILILIPIEIIIFIFYLFKNKKIKNKQIIQNKEIENKLNEKITILNSEINLLEENIKKLEKEIKQEKEDIIFKFNLEKKDILKEILNNKIDFNIEEKNKIEKELENSNKKIVEYKLKLNGIEYEENSINNKLEDSISKEEEYERLKEQLTELQEKNKCILATKDLLEKAYEKMKNNVTPKFTQNLSNIACNISNGKYKKVIFNEEKGLVVELENGEYISVNRLSAGTIDELYLSLRLSMLDEISSEKMPIILDEVFAYFDDERLKNSLIFLAEQSKEHQIIILTCSNREKQILDSINIKYNLVEL